MLNIILILICLYIFIGIIQYIIQLCQDLQTKYNEHHHYHNADN